MYLGMRGWWYEGAPRDTPRRAGLPPGDRRPPRRWWFGVRGAPRAGSPEVLRVLALKHARDNGEGSGSRR
jgi:hypothetical protein